MVVIVYALFDRKTREYGRPVIAKNDDQMRRDLQSLRGSGDTMEKYPEDFDLYQLAEMETETGRVKGLEELEFVDNLRTILEVASGA